MAILDLQAQPGYQVLDGKTVTSKDVKVTYEFSTPDGTNWDMSTLVSIHTPDDATVILNLKQADTIF